MVEVEVLIGVFRLCLALHLARTENGCHFIFFIAPVCESRPLQLLYYQVEFGNSVGWNAIILGWCWEDSSFRIQINLLVLKLPKILSQLLETKCPYFGMLILSHALFNEVDWRFSELDLVSAECVDLQSSSLWVVPESYLASLSPTF